MSTLEAAARLDTAKSDLLAQFARIGRAVASAPRLDLLDLLAQGEKSVETLARQAGLSVKNTSAHLRALRGSALVTTRHEGTRVHYRLADDAVAEFVAALQALAYRRLTEVRCLVQDYFEGPGALDRISATELRRRLAAGSVTLLDVRPSDEFREAHIRGARSVPLAELERRLADLPRDREIVAYCRGPYCVLALKAVARLARHGFAARRYAGGTREWRRERLPVVGRRATSPAARASRKEPT